MSSGKLFLSMLLFMLIISHSVFSATTDSTSLGPTGVNTQLQCTKFNFNYLDVSFFCLLRGR